MKNLTSIEDVKVNANHYNIEGDMLNGGRMEDGKWIPNIYLSQITRPISYINFEKGKVCCPCGREFLINDNLKLVECNY